VVVSMKLPVQVKDVNFLPVEQLSVSQDGYFS
jgi:hypothetical protein